MWIKSLLQRAALSVPQIRRLRDARDTLLDERDSLVAQVADYENRRYRFDPEEPWSKPDHSDSEFYHSMDFPGGESVSGPWDIRGRFDQYIGHYPIHGKTVLDVGTATGFLAFSAEAAGARVTALDLEHVREINLLPFQCHSYYSGDRLAWETELQESWTRKKNGFWYAWHKYQSNVEVIYAPLESLRYTDRKFDVVFAGAILEHLGDPVSTIGLLGRVAKEAVVISFTPVESTDELLMRPITDLSDPQNYFTWWSLSRGLYRRIFQNIGFEIEIVPSHAFNTTVGIEVERPTIIARRWQEAHMTDDERAQTSVSFHRSFVSS